MIFNTYKLFKCKPPNIKLEKPWNLKSLREFQIFGQSYHSDFKLKDLIFSIYLTCQENSFTVRFTWSWLMPLIASARVGRLSYVLLPVFATWPVINREWFSSDRKFDIVSHIYLVELSKTWLKRFNGEENFDDSVRSSIREPLTIESLKYSLQLAH